MPEVVTLTVNVVGVKQQPTPCGEICSQLPPLAAVAATVARMAAPVLVMEVVLLGGFGPVVVLLKRMVGISLKTSGPIVTLTGTETLEAAARNTRWPM